MVDWTVAEPTVLEVEDPVASVDVRIVAGHVDVVTSSDRSARVEVSEIDGPPLSVRVEGRRLVIAHEDLHWSSVLRWRLLSHEHRRAVVSVAVPAECDVSLAVVTAGAVIAGVEGACRIRAVAGDVVLDDTGGEVQVQSVSGDVELRAVRGDVSLKTVSGDLTVVEGRSRQVRAKSVSGDVTLDLQPRDPLRIDVTTVSGDLTVRVPATTGFDVDVLSASGDIASAFDDVAPSRMPGAQRLSGRVGDGSGRVRGRSVSGGVSLLARA
jgi:hypothetical protein